MKKSKRLPKEAFRIENWNSTLEFIVKETYERGYALSSVVPPNDFINWLLTIKGYDFTGSHPFYGDTGNKPIAWELSVKKAEHKQ